MDNSAERGTQGTKILIGVAAALGALAVAGVAWAAIGYFIATTLSLGLILLPLGSGCGSGVLMRLAAHSINKRIGLIAVIVTLMGCVIGDFVWIMLATKKPISLLLGTEAVMTLNTLFNLQKAVMYFFACYIAYAISNPPRIIVPD